MTAFLPEPHLLGSPRRRHWPGALPQPGHRRPARGDVPPARCSVAVVGAGPAGLAVAAALWHLDVRDVVLLDAGERVCGRFLDRCDVLRQRVLRSPYEHHPGVEGYRDCELLDFARLHWSLLTPVERQEVRMAQSGQRSVVPLDVFEAYCGHVVAAHGVADRTWRARVAAVDPGADSVRLHTDAGTVTADAVVLCTGEDRREAPASWWRDRPPAVRYWDEPAPPGTGPVTVVGAGLSAAHVLAAALDAGREAHWVLRDPAEHYQCADVNASFFRAEGRARFTGTPWADRLSLMTRHRRASVMFEFRPRLTAAEADGQLTVWRGGAVTGVDTRAVRLADGRTVPASDVVLCLGTEPSSGRDLLPGAAVGERDGWPDLDPGTLSYSRAPRVHAVGAATAMVLGPAARNIDGHRVATARVAAAAATTVRGAAPAPARIREAVAGA